MPMVAGSPSMLEGRLNMSDLCCGNQAHWIIGLPAAVSITEKLTKKRAAPESAARFVFCNLDRNKFDRFD